MGSCPTRNSLDTKRALVVILQLVTARRRRHCVLLLVERQLLVVCRQHTPYLQGNTTPRYSWTNRAASSCEQVWLSVELLALINEWLTLSLNSGWLLSHMAAKTLWGLYGSFHVPRHLHSLTAKIRRLVTLRSHIGRLRLVKTTYIFQWRPDCLDISCTAA